MIKKSADQPSSDIVQNLITQMIPRFRSVPNINNGTRPVYLPRNPNNKEPMVSQVPKQSMVYPIHSKPILHETKDWNIKIKYYYKFCNKNEKQNIPHSRNISKWICNRTVVERGKLDTDHTHNKRGPRHGPDRIVFGFITTYAISAYYH